MTEAFEGALDIQATRQWLWVVREHLPMFTITDHPTDWPDFYVARMHFTLPEPRPSDFVIMDRDLERLQETMQALGLVKLMRSPGDDPVVLETWL